MSGLQTAFKKLSKYFTNSPLVFEITGRINQTKTKQKSKKCYLILKCKYQVLNDKFHTTVPSIDGTKSYVCGILALY